MKKIMKKILIAVLSLAMIACFVPQTGMQVYAADGDPAMVLGAESVLKATANTDNAQTVWYGENAWRVIKYKDKGNDYITYPEEQDNAMTLFASGLLRGNVVFNNPNNDNNQYKGSNLQSVVNGLYDTLFSAGEKEAILERELTGNAEYISSPPYCQGIAGEETSGYLWPLSTAEAYALPSNAFRDANGNWWLRSPGYNSTSNILAAFVDPNGSVNNGGLAVAALISVRFAFNLDLNSVLFTSAPSASDGGKVSGDVGANALTTVSAYSGNEWKMTIKDGDHADFAVSKVRPGENSVTVEYKKAKTGQDEYISAIITDKPVKEEGAAIKYYGRIAQAAAANSSVTINTAGKLGENDHLYIFNEQYNGDKKTDYASKLTEVAPVSINGAKVALSKTSFTYNGKVQKPTIKTIKGMKLKEGTDYTAKWSNASSKKAGTYTVTVTGKGIYTGTAKATYKINKAANAFKIKARTATVKYAKVKKKAQTLKVSEVIKFTNKGQGTKTYVKKSGNKKITIAKTTGKVTVKKGLKKGTYKVKVKVKAKGNANYKASAWKTVTFKITVK